MLYAASPPPPQFDRFFAAELPLPSHCRRGVRRPSPPLYLGVDCEQWGKECGGRENMDCDMEDPLLSLLFSMPPLPPILRGQSSSCKGVYKSCLNYKLATEERRGPLGGVKSGVSNKQA